MKLEINVRHTHDGDIAAITDIYSQPTVYSGTLQLPYPVTEVWAKRLNDQPVS